MTPPAVVRLPPRRAAHVGLGLLVLAWGMQAIVTQSLLLREALVLMFGSELAWGVVLFAWLFGVSVGAAVGGVLTSRHAVGVASSPGGTHNAGAGRSVFGADAVLVAVLVALSVSVPVELWIFRGARAWLGVQPGELLPLGKTAIAAMLFIAPIGALVGMAFPLACSLSVLSTQHSALSTGYSALSTQHSALGIRHSALSTGYSALSTQHSALGIQHSALSLGRIYALESLGSLIGGAAFSFWAVEHLSPIQTALLCGAITAAASGLLLACTRPGRRAAFVLGGLAGAAVATSVYAGAALNRGLVDRRWRNLAPGYVLCAEAESRYQNLAVGRRENQYTLYCDGQVTADFPDPYTFGPLAHFWMSEHPSPRRILVLGGGAEGLLAEILRHPVDGVDYVEPDPRQIDLIEPFLTDADRRALADPRVAVHHTDARYFIKTQHDRFDLVIARLPEPTSALRARLYTDEFYGELRRAMTPCAVLCMTAAATPTSLSAAGAEYLASIRATLRRHFPNVIVGWGDPAQILAATADGLATIDPEELARRYRHSGVRSDLFTASWFSGATDALDAAKVRQRSAELDAAKADISTDLRPIVYVQRLVLWERMTGGRSGRTIEWLRTIGAGRLLAALALIAGAVMVLCRLRAGSHRGWAGGAIVVSIGTTGFATMALSLIWLFAFQNLYGYVYQRIGWIIAIFMGGLVVGCGATSLRLTRLARALARTSLPQGESNAVDTYRWRRLVAVDVAIALLAVIAPLVLPWLGAMRASPFTFALVESIVSILVAVTGVLCGAAFTIAGGLRAAGGASAASSAESGSRAGAAAGSVVGADHAGACLGALLTGVLLVPVFGTATAAFMLAALKLGSAALLLLGRRFS